MTGADGSGVGETLHATTVAVGDAGILILGPSGSGKSALALQLMAHGAALVADDRTQITKTPDGVIASAPSALRGLIEARGIGILRAPVVTQVRLRLVVDLGQTETARLPPRRTMQINGHVIDLVFGPASAHLPSAILCYVAGGRHE